MKTSTIYFYAVGLNEKNYAFDKTAFTRILSNGAFLDGDEERAVVLSQPLAFGSPFQISVENYEIFKSATYILILNTDTEKETEQGRYAFINNFLELANGNYSVSYSLDDYTNYILYASEMGVSPHIDGFTERANIPLIEKSGNNYIVKTSKFRLQGRAPDNLRKEFFYNSTYGHVGFSKCDLPTGWTCAVYSIPIPKNNGVSVEGANAHGYITDFTARDNAYRSIRRENSNLYIKVFDENGNSIPFFYKDENDNIKQLLPYGSLSIEGEYQIINNSQEHKIQRNPDRDNYISLYEPDDATIEKIMYFPFIPCIDAYDTAGNLYANYFGHNSISGYSVTNVFTVKTMAEIDPSLSSYTGADLKAIMVNMPIDNTNSADICVKEDKGTQPLQTCYFKAVAVRNFAPLFWTELPQDVEAEDDVFQKQITLNNYYLFSAYDLIDETRKIKVKFLSTELEIPCEIFNRDAKIYITFSGDLETVVLKYYSASLAQTFRSNSISATGQNTAYFDLVQVRDFKAYKNAKITAAASVVSSVVGGVGGVATGLKTGNIFGAVGGVVGGVGGVIGGLQKLEQLTPAQLSPANFDFTLSEILSDTVNLNLNILYNVIFEISNPAPSAYLSFIRYLEENGAAVSMPYDEFMANCQMSVYNALKMEYVEITGIPQQAARRIADLLVSGVTLWTGSNVGNKKVINYPVETFGA